MSIPIFERLANGDLPVNFDWNKDEYPKIPIPSYVPAQHTLKQATNVTLFCECLRDGLHGVGEVYPAAEEMIQYVDQLADFGIDNMTIGIYPGKGTKIDTTIKKLLSLMRDQQPEVTPIVLSFANKESLDWVGDLSQINPKLTPLIFMGTAPSRMLVEEWSKEHILKNLAWAINEAKTRHETNVIGATEHTTQTPPDFLKEIIKTQVDSGIDVFCIADTIGIARPGGTYRLVTHVKQILQDLNAEHILVDWHGHDDLGNGTNNALVAISAGANRIHVVARGAGERAGNTQLEGVIANLKMIYDENNNPVPWKLEMLNNLLQTYDRLIKRSAPINGPFGARAFRTSLGIHTAAMLKAEALSEEALRLGQPDIAFKLSKMSRHIYSALDPEQFGRKHEVRVGHWSGASSVRLAYLLMGGNLETLSDDKIQLVLTAAKSHNREFEPEELHQLLFNGINHG